MNDLISRQAAIDALACLEDYEEEAIEALRKLPSAQETKDAVEVVRCKDCRWKEREQPGMVYCPATVGGWVDEDWFCKGGETDE